MDSAEGGSDDYMYSGDEYGIDFDDVKENPSLLVCLRIFIPNGRFIISCAGTDMAS